MTKGRVLVTGRHGFTGRYVADSLSAAGWEVWGLGPKLREGADWYHRTADLRDAASIAKALEEVRPDAVVHLAAVTFVAHCSPDDFYHVNLMGTRNLLAMLARGGHGSKGVVIASSANIYGNARTSPISENALPAPGNDYAVSKLAMEHMARLYSGELPIVITRPFNYTGLGQDVKFLVPKIVSHFRDSLPRIELGNLDVARDFSDVRDVARIYSDLLDSQDVHGETVNICSGRAISLAEIVDMCRSLTGHNIEVAVNPAFVRSKEINRLTGDPSRLNTIVDGLTRHPFEDTLKWMLLD